MRRLIRQRTAVVAIGLLLSTVGSLGANADTDLVAKCNDVARGQGSSGSFPSPGGSGLGTLTCDVRATGFAVFKDVTAKLKGETGDLETKFEAFDPVDQGTTTYYLIQVLPNARRTTLAQMTDAVATFGDQRAGKRRFTAFTFSNELTLVSDSGVSNAEFVRQVVAVKPATGAIQLYKTALQAIESLTKETGDRKSLVILGDGASDDTGYDHDQVVKAARDASVTIHVLGFYDDAKQRPKFQKLARLAKDTDGYAAEVKQGGRDLNKDIVSSRFIREVIENGGTVKTSLKGPTGAQTVEFTASLSDSKNLKTEAKVDIPAAPQPRSEPSSDSTVEKVPPPPTSALDDIWEWIGDNAILVAGLGALLGLGAVGFFVYGRNAAAAEVEAAEAEDDAEADTNTQDAAAGAGPGELLRDANGTPVIYGWLEMLDGNASRHPLKTTNVRVGRHRDNDICLQNDSISRRHALLHYNADKRRFVITDLGGGNGVVVNKTRTKSRELQDGDLVELGEVRLRFRAEQEYLA